VGAAGEVRPVRTPSVREEAEDERPSSRHVTVRIRSPSPLSPLWWPVPVPVPVPVPSGREAKPPSAPPPSAPPPSAPPPSAAAPSAAAPSAAAPSAAAPSAAAPSRNGGALSITEALSASAKAFCETGAAAVGWAVGGGPKQRARDARPGQSTQSGCTGSAKVSVGAEVEERTSEGAGGRAGGQAGGRAGGTGPGALGLHLDNEIGEPRLLAPRQRPAQQLRRKRRGGSQRPRLCVRGRGYGGGRGGAGALRALGAVAHVSHPRGQPPAAHEPATGWPLAGGNRCCPGRG
jgi:hypothetical protein